MPSLKAQFNDIVSKLNSKPDSTPIRVDPAQYPECFTRYGRLLYLGVHDGIERYFCGHCREVVTSCTCLEIPTQEELKI